MESNETMAEVVPANAVLAMNVPTILKGLTEVGSLEIPDFSLNLKISELAQKLSIAEKTYLKSVGSLVKKHIETNERGIPMVVGDGPYRSYVYKSAEDKENYLAEMDKLNNTIVDGMENYIGFLKTSVLKDVKGLRAFTMIKLGVLVKNDIS